MEKLGELLSGEEGQDIAEYAVMLAVMLVLVIATVRLVNLTPTCIFSSKQLLGSVKINWPIAPRRTPADAVH